MTGFVILYFAAVYVPEQYRVLAQILSLMVYSFVTIVTLVYWKRMLYVLLKDPLFTLFIGFACVSILWSANAQATSDETKFLLRATVFGVYLATRYSTRELLQLLSWTLGLSMVFSFLVGIAIPQYTTHLAGSWKGVFAHKQSLGAMMGFAASVFLSQILGQRLSRKWMPIALYGLVFSLVLLSKSQTGLMIFLLSLVTSPLYKAAKQKRYRGLLIILVLMALATAASILLVNFETVVVYGLGKNLQLNGRIPIWVIAIAKGLESPWLGYGFQGFWTSDVSDVVLQNVPWIYHNEAFRTRAITFHSHNGYIELFLQLGLVGIALYGTCFILCCKRIVTLLLTTRSAENFWMFQFMGIMLIANLSEAWGVLTPSLFWVLYVTLSYSSALQSERLQKSIASTPANSFLMT
jgi:exopolysaccharide production protein ExoQ